MKGFGWFLFVVLIAGVLWTCFVGVPRFCFGGKARGTVINVDGIDKSVSRHPVLVDLDTTRYLAFTNRKACTVELPYGGYSRLSVKPKVKDTVGFRDVLFVVNKIQAVHDVDTIVRLSGKCIQIDF